MTTQYWLNTATHFLESNSITTARLDCLVLLEDTINVNRAQLLAEPTMEMKAAWVAHLQKLLARRAKHEPLSYIRGHSEFYGRKFIISPSVLTPRPESESIIELLKGLPITGKTVRIGDIGTGSGSLGITAALELTNASVDLLEIDQAALKVAQTNVDRLTTGISVIKADLLDGSPCDYDVLLCNLPYVPDKHKINKAAGYEPPIALFGGPDGLDLYRKLFEQLGSVQKRPLFILTESLPEQHVALGALSAGNGYKLLKTDCFVQLFGTLRK